MVRINTHHTGSKFGYIFLALFGLPFAAIGLFIAYLLVGTITTAISMQGWPTIPATLQEIKIESESAKSKTERVVASYHYEVKGQKFTGTKVSPYGADNLGSFHRRNYETLLGYQSRNESFPAHVNPDNPSESVLFPAIRWEVIGFYLVFILTFGGFGFGSIITAFSGIKRARHEKALRALYPNEPWRHRLEWSTAKIKSSQGLIAKVLVGAAILVNAISLPVLFAVPSMISEGKYIILIFLIFPILGLALAYWAAVNFARARRFGNTHLELATFPGRQGEQLRGRIFAPNELAEATTANITMTCERHYRIRRNGKSESKMETLWTSATTAQIIRGQTASGEVVINVEFDIPSSFPDSSQDSGESHQWQMAASAPLKGADFQAKFEVPVFRR